MNYHQLLNATLALYFEEKYKEAYALITEKSRETICNDAQIDNFRYSIACVMGDTALALEILGEAVMKKGYWYSHEYLMEDEDLKPLRDDALFKEIVKLCKKREEENVSKAEMFTIEPADLSAKTPALMAIHGNQENFQIIKAHWDRDVFKDYVKFYPQSSVEEFSTGFLWDDPIKGALEIKEHMKAIEETTFDHDDLTVTAFSAGASVALQSIVDGTLKVRNLFLLGPWLPNLDSIKDQLSVLNKENVKVVLACGDVDEDCYDETKKLSKTLADMNVVHEFYVLEGVAHEYPSELDEILEAAVAYFNN